jgi:cytochrome c-type biogenesis protein
MPGYLAYISSAEDTFSEGPSGGLAVRALHRTQAVRSALLFVTGFGSVFTVLGAGASAMSGALLENRLILTRVGGVVIIVMGLVVTGILRIPALMREYRMDLSRIRPGPAGAFPLGMAFAIGWVPCIGPASSESVGRGAVLLALYSAGLALPFIGLAVASSRVDPLIGWLRRNARLVELSGGGVMIVMGVLLLTNQWLRVFAPLTALFSRFGWPPI